MIFLRMLRIRNDTQNAFALSLGYASRGQMLASQEITDLNSGAQTQSGSLKRSNCVFTVKIHLLRPVHRKSVDLDKKPYYRPFMEDKR